jgi:hypothetical protein
LVGNRFYFKWRGRGFGAARAAHAVTRIFTFSRIKLSAAASLPIRWQVGQPELDDGVRGEQRGDPKVTVAVESQSAYDHRTEKVSASAKPWLRPQGV